MNDEIARERERQQIEQILELDLEELQVEEVDDLHELSDDDHDAIGRGGAVLSGEITFDPCLASLHTYLGEVEDTHHRVAFLDGGAVFNLPIFYLEGVVLFPEATLPLRVIQNNSVAAVERALSQADAPYTIGVIRAHRDYDSGRIKFATIGTTAEIRQYRRLEDGSLNVVTRGQQRFHLRRRWIDQEGAPCGEIQIIQEDIPLRAPRDAFRNLTPFCSLPRMLSSNSFGDKLHRSRDVDNDSVASSNESFESALSPTEKHIHQYTLASCSGHGMLDESESSDDEKSRVQSQRPHLDDTDSFKSSHSEPDNGYPGVGNSSIASIQSCRGEQHKTSWKNIDLNQLHRVSSAYWPYWVYSMYDSYSLAQKAADMWKQIVGAPNLDGLVKKPVLLSFYIASKVPVSESTRQELLEIDGISYRLRREIQLLERVDIIRCRNCRTVIARRSDTLAMSSDGPLGAYVNPYGFVHEIMTLYKATGLALRGAAVREYSWFPGYAWTITNCATCETQMGWLFTATNGNLKPKLFWGIRSCQVSDDAS